MAKVGYIFKANSYDALDADKEWMRQYGCVQVVEEECAHEALRPQWKQLMASLGRGDELVVAKFSNAVRDLRGLAALVELCRIKVVRLVSIHDKIDTLGELFPDTTAAQVLEMFGALPEEVAVLRKSSSHIMQLQQTIKPPVTKKAMSRAEREKTIVDTRKRAEFVFPDGKVGFFDFAGEQYFNYFRTRHLTLQGDCGEVHDQQAAWLGQDGYPVQGSIQRDELGQYSNLEGYGMRSLRLNGEILYRNPYADRDLRLTDEEIAVAQMMEGMKTYVETGKEVYPLEEALQDTYLFLMMDEAAKEGKEIQTQDQCWKKQ